MDDRRADGVVATSRAKRRDRPLVIATGKTEVVYLERRMTELRFGKIGHDFTCTGASLAAIALAIKRAVMGEPS